MSYVTRYHMSYHQLYVLTGDPSSRSSTLNLLKFIHGNIQVLKNMGVVVKVIRITKEDLGNKRIVKSMQDKGISRLPAMIIPSGKIIIGVERILTTYKSNISEFAKTNKVPVKSPSSSLGDFYKSQIAKGDDDDDEEDSSFGEGSGMITSYHQMLSNREQTKPPSTKSAAGLQQGGGSSQTTTGGGRPAEPKKDGNNRASLSGNSRPPLSTTSNRGTQPNGGTAPPFGTTQPESRPDNVAMGLVNCDEDDGADDLMERAFLMNNGDLDD